MSKKIWILIITILAIVLIYSSIVYQGSFEGKVTDAVTKEPIKNLDIQYAYRLTNFCIGVDTCPGYNAKELRLYTDQNGNYVIPGFFSFKIPFSHSPQIMISFPAEDVRYQTQFATEYVFERVDTAGFFDTYPTEIRPTFSKQRVDISLTPKLNDSIEPCKLITESWLRERCINVNSFDVAVKTKNASLCDVFGEGTCENESGSYVCDSPEKKDCKNAVYYELAKSNISYCQKIDKSIGCSDCYPNQMFIDECIRKVEMGLSY